MREISIVEIYNSLTKKFENVNDSIRNGIFNEKTCEFYDPNWNQKYSLVEAAQRGLFKIIINTIPTRLIVEKRRVVETYSLIDTVDPQDYEKSFSIDEALQLGIIDLHQGTYKHQEKHTEMELIDAIDKNFVHANLLRSISELIRLTYVEQFEMINQESLPETQVTIEDDRHTLEFNDDSGYQNQTLVVDDPMKHFYEQTKLIESNQTEIKQKFKSHALVTIGLLKDSSFNENMINEIFSHETSYSYALERNKLKFLTTAIDQGVVVLPIDNFELINEVLFAIDKLSGDLKDYDEAVEEGLIDEKSCLYKNTDTDEYISLFEALRQGLICIDNRLNDELFLSDIHTIFNPNTGQQITLAKAVQEGLFSLRQKAFIDPKTKKQIPIQLAIEKSLIILKNDFDDALVIQFVIDPQNGQKLSLNEAIDRGLINYVDGLFELNGVTITLDEAFSKGYLITTERRLNDSQHLSSNEYINKSTSPCTYSKFYDELCQTTEVISIEERLYADKTIVSTNEDPKILFSTPKKILTVKV